LIRSDASDARQTLSEGEKSFVTFLYFYHLLKGSESESGMTENRVVVFDDPVSSLDSDVLFIVSSLIKLLFEEMRQGKGYIKQIFVMTHNVYFHKEITFLAKRKDGEKKVDRSYWVVRKTDSGSIVTRHESNPIKTSYDLLWNEVRRADRCNLTIQNTLRRILENYFKILGGVEFDDICAKFDGREKLICQSLLSWVNDGSHYAHDDLYFTQDAAAIDGYLDIFKRVFIETDQERHYDMMMAAES
jgi:wobble nucleotide-excising tRNase